MSTPVTELEHPEKQSQKRTENQGTTQKTAKAANMARQTSDGKPPVGTHHSGVPVQTSVTKKKK
jgi:hypothetical protein